MNPSQLLETHYMSEFEKTIVFYSYFLLENFLNCTKMSNKFSEVYEFFFIF